MATNYTDLQEIEEIISSIKKVARDTLCHGFSNSQIWTRLHHLKDFITHLDDGQDLLNVIEDFIEVGSTGLNDKLLLKTNILKLEETFAIFKSKKGMYRYLLHV